MGGPPKQNIMKDLLKSLAALAAFTVISSMAVMAILNERFSHAIIFALCAVVIWYLSNDSKSK